MRQTGTYTLTWLACLINGNPLRPGVEPWFDVREQAVINLLAGWKSGQEVKNGLAVTPAYLFARVAAKPKSWLPHTPTASTSRRRISQVT
jgi:hypothetical protein